MPCRRPLVFSATLLLALATAAGAYHRHAGHHALPGWRAAGPGDRVVVLAPHPDDEILGTGGVLQRARARDATVRVLFLTSGDGFRAAAVRLARRQRPLPADYRRLAERREREATAAARVLGVSPEALQFLRFPDRGLWSLWTTNRAPGRAYLSRYTRRSAADPAGERPFTGTRLLGELKSALGAARPTELYLPDERDENHDHRATHRFGIAALRALGTLSRTRVGTYLVHHGGWPGGGHWPWRGALYPPAGRVAEAWRSFDLTPGERRRKAGALEEYRSQTVVMGARLRALDRPNELFLGYVPSAE